MIRINLLQVGARKKKKPIPAFVILLVVLIIATVLGVGVEYVHLKSEVNELKAEKAKNDAYIQELKAKVKEVDDFEKKIKLFQQKKEVILGLRENQSIPVKFLNELSYALADSVWLSDLSLKAGKVNITGYAFTNTNVVDFVNNLKRSAMFDEVYLEESKESTLEKLDIYQFRLRFVIVKEKDGQKT